MKPFCLWCVAALAAALGRAAETEALPQEYRLLAPLLGNWEGQAEVETSVAGRREIRRYEKTSTCRLGPDGRSLVMEDTEIDAATGAMVKVHALVRHDRASNTYKALVWDSEGGSRLLVIEPRDGTFDFRRLDLEEGTTFTSFVRVQEGGLYEQGRMEHRGPTPWAVEWRVRYRRAEREASRNSTQVPKPHQPATASPPTPPAAANDETEDR